MPISHHMKTKKFSIPITADCTDIR